jgi:histidinol-phosphate aminotransferase
MTRTRAYEVDARNYKIKLNANENPYPFIKTLDCKGLNRYPDNRRDVLLETLSNHLALEPSQIILENGSSGNLELILKSFLKPGDKVMSFEPTFVMYKKYTEIFHGNYIGVKSNDFVMDMDLLKKRVLEENPKIVFLCNPNNPTGAKVSKVAIESFAKSFSGLLVVDEAYMEYSEGSMINRLDVLENVLVIKTFSKAYGLAGVRLGYVVGPLDLIKTMKNYKSPYSVNQVAIELAIEALKSKEVVMDQIKISLEERRVMYDALMEMPLRVYASQGNFIFFKGSKAIASYLENLKTGIRSFDDGYYRVSIGLPEENKIFIKQMNDFFYKNMMDKGGV